MTDIIEYFDRQGNKITEKRREELYWNITENNLLAINKDYVVVKKTELLDEEITITTTWTGTAIKRGPNGPIIFMTVVSRADSTEREIYEYATEEEAIKSHDYLVYTNIDEHIKVSRFTQVAREL